MSKQRTRAAIGRQNRSRGQAFERTVAKALKAVWPEARRNLSQTRGAKKEGGDILGTPYFVEVKSSKRENIPEAWERAAVDGHPYQAVVVYRAGRSLMVYDRVNHMGRLTRAAMLLEDWLRCHVGGGILP